MRMRKIIFIVIIIFVSFVAGYYAGGYNIDCFKIPILHSEDTCPYLKNHASAISENVCPYLKNKEAGADQCSYLNGKVTKPSDSKKVKTTQLKSS